MAIHQCARFCNNSRLVYERSIRRIAKYLASTSTYVDLPDGNLRIITRGVVSSPAIEELIKCFVDANLIGGWGQVDADNE